MSSFASTRISATIMLLITLIILPILEANAVELKVNSWCLPVFTPCDENRNIKIEVIPEYAQFLYNHGIDCVLVSGTSGEFSTLSLLEKKILLDAWIIVAKPLGFKIIIHVGGAPYPDVIEMTKYAELAQVDAIMTLPESFYRPTTPEQLVEFMQGLSEAAPSTPLIYYHHPKMTGVNVNMPQFFALASEKIPNFKGTKTSLPIALDIQIYNEVKADQRLFILGETIAQDVLLGFNTMTCTLLNIFPDLLQTIKQYGSVRDSVMALKTQAEMNKLYNIITSKGDRVSTMKAAMEVVTGIKVGPTRKPLPVITEQQKLIMAIKLQELGVVVSKEYRL